MIFSDSFLLRDCRPESRWNKHEHMHFVPHIRHFIDDDIVLGKSSVILF